MLVPLQENLVDIVWAEERPLRPANKVFQLDIEHAGEYANPKPACHGVLIPSAGESHLDKIRRLREELTKKKAAAMVVTMLDEVAWLFNLRGSDIDFNPGGRFLAPVPSGADDNIMKSSFLCVCCCHARQCFSLYRQ